MADANITDRHSIRSLHWGCKPTWRRASINTLWCLLGCSIGDFGTIAFFQFTGIAWPVLAIMTLAIFNGLITSIALETLILSRQMATRLAFKTAIGMSFISMVAMEVAMNLTDVLLTGGAKLVTRAISPEVESSKVLKRLGFIAEPFSFTPHRAKMG